MREPREQGNLRLLLAHCVCGFFRNSWRVECVPFLRFWGRVNVFSKHLGFGQWHPTRALWCFSCTVTSWQNFVRCIAVGVGGALKGENYVRICCFSYSAKVFSAAGSPSLTPKSQGWCFPEGPLEKAQVENNVTVALAWKNSLRAAEKRYCSIQLFNLWPLFRSPMFLKIDPHVITI